MDRDMETMPIRKLPIGIQDFTSLIEDGYLYVDKTALVYQMVTRGKPYFMNRPRRFGKSLLLSTLEAYFLGRKDLFKGLAIEKLEKEWKVYPVLLLSLNAQYYENKISLEQILEGHFIRWERYDGYYFSEFQTEGIFNPFSVLNALEQKRFSSYWFATGTPTMLVDMLKKTDYDLRQLDGIEVPAAALTDYRADYHNPVPIIYQSGYLTVKDYDPMKNFYVLGYPNAEVEYGWLNFITPYYTPTSSILSSSYWGNISMSKYAVPVVVPM